jgi:hypothetical protein
MLGRLKKGMIHYPIGCTLEYLSHIHLCLEKKDLRDSGQN